MSEQRDVRVSDQERQLAADRLRIAMDEGRLDLLEYDSRLLLAYQSETYADLERLFTDLPAIPVPVAPAQPTPARRPRPIPRPIPRRSPVRGLPMALKVLWTVWAGVMAINLTVWGLVSLGEWTYFWPMWLLVPGTALLGVSIGVQAIRRGGISG